MISDITFKDQVSQNHSESSTIERQYTTTSDFTNTKHIMNTIHSDTNTDSTTTNTTSNQGSIDTTPTGYFRNNVSFHDGNDDDDDVHDGNDDDDGDNDGDNEDGMMDNYFYNDIKELSHQPSEHEELSSIVLVHKFEIPGTILYQCLSFLTTKETQQIRLVCRNWKRIVQGRSFIIFMQSKMEKEISLLLKKQNELGVGDNKKIFKITDEISLALQYVAGLFITYYVANKVIHIPNMDIKGLNIPAVSIALASIKDYKQYIMYALSRIISKLKIPSRYDEKMIQVYSQLICSVKEKYKHWTFPNVESLAEYSQNEAKNENYVFMMYQSIHSTKKPKMPSKCLTPPDESDLIPSESVQTFNGNQKNIIAFIGYHTNVSDASWFRKTNVKYIIFVTFPPNESCAYPKTHRLEKSYQDFWNLHESLITNIEQMNEGDNERNAKLKEFYKMATKSFPETSSAIVNIFESQAELIVQERFEYFKKYLQQIVMLYDDFQQIRDFLTENSSE